MGWDQSANPPEGDGTSSSGPFFTLNLQSPQSNPTSNKFLFVENKRLRRQIDNLVNRNRELEDIVLVLRKDQEEKRKAFGKNEQDQQLTATSSQFTEQIDNLRRRNSEQEAKLAASEKSCKQLKTENLLMKHQLNESQNKLIKTLPKLAEAANECRSEKLLVDKAVGVEVCKCRLEIEETTEAKTETLNSRTKMANKWIENLKRQESLKAARDENAPGSSRAELNEQLLKAKIESALTNAIAMLEKMNLDLHVKDMALKDKETELNRLKEENNQQKQQLKEDENTIKKLNRDALEIAADLYDCKKQLDMQQKFDSDLQSQLSSAIKHVQNTADNLKNVEGELRARQLEMEKMRRENSKLAMKLESNETVSSFTALLRESAEERNNFKIDAKAYQDTIHALENQLWEYCMCANRQIEAREIVIEELKEKIVSQEVKLKFASADHLKDPVDHEQQFKRLHGSEELKEVSADVTPGRSDAQEEDFRQFEHESFVPDVIRDEKKAAAGQVFEIYTNKSDNHLGMDQPRQVPTWHSGSKQYKAKSILKLNQRNSRFTGGKVYIKVKNGGRRQLATPPTVHRKGKIIKGRRILDSPGDISNLYYVPNAMECSPFAEDDWI